MEKQCITVKEVMALWDLKESAAYRLIRECNAELKSKGCLTVAGKCPRQFFYQKMGLTEPTIAQ